MVQHDSQQRLRILAVSPQLPYPLHDGGRKAIYHQLRAMRDRGHSVHLVCLSENPRPEFVDPLREFATVTVFKHKKSATVLGMLQSLNDTVPYLVKRFHDGRVLAELDQLAAHHDVLHCEGLHCAWYGQEIARTHGIVTCLRLHNIESQILDRWRRVEKNLPRRVWASLEGSKLERYERRTYPEFHGITTLSQNDLKRIRSDSPRTTSVAIPPGVDMDYFRPSSDPVVSKRILWLGALNWPPNIDGLRWFCETVAADVLERDPTSEIVVVGSSPPAWLKSYARPRLKIVGEVPDVRPWIEKSAVCVVPLRVGGGVRFKLLELLAMAKAVVSTSIGCEGLGLESERHLLVRDTPEGMTEAILQLLSDPGQARALGLRGLEFVSELYSWERAAERYEELLFRLLKIGKV